MAFDLDTWKQKVRERLDGIRERLEQAKTKHAPGLVYAALSGATLWPLVDAARTGQFIPVVVALGAIAGGVGGNLIAEQIQRWKDAADGIDEDAIARWVEEGVNDPSLREAVDQVIEKLDAIALAQAKLDETARGWFDQQLRVELERLGNLRRFEAKLIGRGAIAQNGGVAAGERGVAAAGLPGIAQTGDGSRAVQAGQYIEHQEVHLPSPSPTATARERYLKRLSQRCKVLPLAALGGDEDTGDTVRLDLVYISLDTEPRVESEPRSRSRPDQEPKRLSALDVATDARRLVLLGGPGSGKSSFVHHPAARLADAALCERNGPPGWEKGMLPLLLTLRDLRVSELRLDGLSGKERDHSFVEAVWICWHAALEEFGATELRPELEAALDAGRVLLVFDGLDEVPERARERVRAAVGAVLRTYPAVPRVIVTCRTRSYAGQAVLSDFAAHTLAALRPEQVGQFIHAWYNAQAGLGRMDSGRAANRASDLEEAALSDDLRGLSSNPMLLTVMAIVHQRNVRLPPERVRLYAQVIDVMLSRWQQHKGIRVSDRLAEVLRDGRRLRAYLERLAYQVHGAQAAQGEGSSLLRTNLLGMLEGLDYLGELNLAGEFLDYVDQSAGLLVGHGGEKGHAPRLRLSAPYVSRVSGRLPHGFRTCGRERTRVLAAGWGGRLLGRRRPPRCRGAALQQSHHGYAGVARPGLPAMFWHGAGCRRGLASSPVVGPHGGLGRRRAGAPRHGSA